MKITILKVKLDQEAQDFIYNQLLAKFNVVPSDETYEGGKVNFPLNEDIEVHGDLYLSSGWVDSKKPGHGPTFTRFAQLKDFYLTIDGDQIEVEDFNIDDRIQNYLSI